MNWQLFLAPNRGKIAVVGLLFLAASAVLWLRVIPPESDVFHARLAARVLLWPLLKLPAFMYRVIAHADAADVGPLPGTTTAGQRLFAVFFDTALFYALACTFHYVRFRR